MRRSSSLLLVFLEAYIAFISRPTGSQDGEIFTDCVNEFCCLRQSLLEPPALSFCARAVIENSFHGLTTQEPVSEDLHTVVLQYTGYKKAKIIAVRHIIEPVNVGSLGLTPCSIACISDKSHSHIAHCYCLQVMI